MTKPYPTLLEQMKDNPWMEDILIKKSKNQTLSQYHQFLFELMKEQPLPPGGIEKVISMVTRNNYEGKTT